jgi:hypothetical protein
MSAEQISRPIASKKRAPSPGPSPPVGERVPEGRVRGSPNYSLVQCVCQAGDRIYRACCPNHGARLCAKHQSQRPRYSSLLRLGLRPQPRSVCFPHDLGNRPLTLHSISPSAHDARVGRGAILARDGPPLPNPLLPPREEREFIRWQWGSVKMRAFTASASF